MKAELELRDTFELSLAQFLSSPPMQRVTNGELTVEHYKSILREIYFYTREDPQLQAFATAWFKGDDRSTVRTFLKHAISEVGHDRLALDDLEALGRDTATIPYEFPLATTVALTSFPYWATQFLSPVSYLGYLYFLEALPTTSGAALMDALLQSGVPDSAMTFIQEHATIDVAHVKLMDGYVEKLIRTDQDLTDVSYALTTTAKLYELMIEGAMQAADQPVRSLHNLGEVSRLAQPPLTAAA